jgi:endonuclease/exonuclease/phosphatase family metal-dependent hydrolase
MFRRTVLAVSIFLAGVSMVAARQDESVVKVMTQNVDAGTDLGYVVVALLTSNPVSGVDSTYAEIRASNIPGRMELVAAQIAAQKPHIVGLQEVTLWRTGPSPQTATTVLYDQLDLIMAALKKMDVSYEVVAVNRLTDIALPMTAGALRFTDRDALLVRSDLGPSELHVSDVHTHIYDAVFSLGGLSVTQGWIAANVRVNNKLFRFATTHLQSPVPGVPEAAVVQGLQAEELLYAFRNSPMPVVLIGDFNSDAILGTGGGGPDATATAALIEAAGYTDTWRAANPGYPGATWPLYLEDRTPPNFLLPWTPFERIDLIWSRGLSVQGSLQVGQSPPFPSDHTGVVTTFRLDE